jgi:hypothetical protein
MQIAEVNYNKTTESEGKEDEEETLSSNEQHSI